MNVTSVSCWFLHGLRSHAKETLHMAVWKKDRKSASKPARPAPQPSRIASELAADGTSLMQVSGLANERAWLHVGWAKQLASWAQTTCCRCDPICNFKNLQNVLVSHCLSAASISLESLCTYIRGDNKPESSANGRLVTPLPSDQEPNSGTAKSAPLYSDIRYYIRSCILRFIRPILSE